jgi:hypothetical protein
MMHRPDAAFLHFSEKMVDTLPLDMVLSLG